MAFREQELWYPSAENGMDVFARVWDDDAAQPAFVLQIVHGMVEYIDRYRRFAEFIVQNGGAVCGEDHLGHGHTGEKGQLGYIAERDGEVKMVEDVRTLHGIVWERYPDVPVFVLGHSMGSFIARLYAVQYGQDAAGMIFMGTAGENKQIGVLRSIAKLAKAFGRGKKPAKVLSNAAFGKNNDRYENVRTTHDWLTRDEGIVDVYLKDPWCTFLFTNSAMLDMANLLGGIEGEPWAAKLPKDVPYLVISGDMDPVGGYGEGVKQVFGWMERAGVQDATLKLYEGARHEVLNELNKEEVYADILAWMKAHLS